MSAVRFELNLKGYDLLRRLHSGGIRRRTFLATFTKWPGCVMDTGRTLATLAPSADSSWLFSIAASSGMVMLQRQPAAAATMARLTPVLPGQHAEHLRKLKSRCAQPIRVPRTACAWQRLQLPRRRQKGYLLGSLRSYVEAQEEL